MLLTKDDKINYLNIGLMLLSMAAAFIMPFEVFLFSYAFMGPLHYLTEISWLHDRQYFTKGKYDFLVLLISGILISYMIYARDYNFWPYSKNSSLLPNEWMVYEKFLFISFWGAVILAFVKNNLLKIGAIAIITLLGFSVYNYEKIGNEPESLASILLTTFVPTLIHVYLFTGLFMLFGALKSRSKSGLISVLVFIVIPFLLFYLFRDFRYATLTDYGKNAYGDLKNTEGFFSLNTEILKRFFGFSDPIPASNIKTQEQYIDFLNSAWISNVFNTETGIVVMRFIAFAYTYHYLNWFSKTEIIKWHQVPKARFIAVIAIWIISVALYIKSYKLGLQWLFFLSFTHVLLEFPLNFTSFVGIFKESHDILLNGFSRNKSSLSTK